MVKWHLRFVGALVFSLLVTYSVHGKKIVNADILIVKHLDSKPVFDGKVDPSIRDAAVGGMIQHLLGEQKTAQVQTNFWCGYTEEGLYVAFECQEPRMDTLVKNSPGTPELKLSHGDSVEVFLVPPGERVTRHFLLTTENLQGDYWDDGGSDTDVLWDPLWESAVWLGKDRWSAEIFIPWHSLSLTGRVRGDWKVNFTRSRLASNEFISWRPVKRQYCEPRNFGVLRGLDLEFPVPVASPPVLPGALSLKATKLLNTACDKFRGADLPKLTEREPFKAAAWMSILSSMEWVKRSLEIYQRLFEKSALLDHSISKLQDHENRLDIGDAEIRQLRRNAEQRLRLQGRLCDRATQLEHAILELNARLAVIEGRKPDAGYPIMELLRLTTDSDAQVIVEFERSRLQSVVERKRASVSINWGSLPLMITQVEEFPTAEKALKSIEKFKTLRTQKIIIGGYDCYFTTLPYWQPSELKSYNPSEDFILMLSPRKIGITPISALEENDVDALVFFPTCPEKIQKDLTIWAAKAGKKVFSLSQANSTKRVAFFGALDNGKMGKMLKQLAVYRFAVSSQTGVLRFVKRTLAFSLPCLSMDSGKLFAQLILKGDAISLEQADQIRQAVVRAISREPKTLKLPEGMNLYVGDVHGHTYCSDGSSSPLGLIAEAFYADLDFCTISDHHWGINGAARLRSFMDRIHFDYPMIPAVEITEKWAHFNVYPIKENSENFSVSSCDTLEKVLQYAKMQGNAIVQWNHPDDWLYTTQDDLSFDAKSGIDAWETYPPCYDAWKKAGTLPAITGGTDTHTGVFSSSFRTIILAESPSDESLAKAIRRRNVALIDPYDGACYQAFWEIRRIPRMNTGSDRYVYGDDRMIQVTVDALADGKYLKEQKKQLIRESLADINLGELLSSNDTLCSGPEKTNRFIKDKAY